MDVRIEFPQRLYDDLRKHLLQAPDGREDAAYLICGVVRAGNLTKLLVRDVHKVPDPLASKGHAHVTVDPDFISVIVKRARTTGSAIILTHSHPFSRTHVDFSGIDDGGENALIPRLQQQIQGVPHGAIVFGQASLQARFYAPGSMERKPASVRVIGNRVFEPGNSQTSASARYSRQRDYVGENGQCILERLRVGIVGLGGTGSHVLQQLRLLGVRKFVLIDSDKLDDTNLNRVVHAKTQDIGRPKVEIAKDSLNGTEGVKATSICGDVRDLAVARALLDCDVVVGCTDTMSSRVVLNRIVHQAYVPLIDTGIELARDPEGRIGTGVVRAEPVTLDQPCLECRGVLGIDRNAGGYGAGDHHAVSVVHLNAMCAALTVDILLSLFTDAPTRRPPHTSHQYRVLDGMLKPYRIERITNCTLCIEVLGQGDAFPYPCNT